MADTNLTKTKKQPFGKRIKKFLTETKAELKKVTWPTREQLMHNTGVIIVFIVIMTVILAIADTAFAKVFSLFTGLFQ